MTAETTGFIQRHRDTSSVRRENLPGRVMLESWYAGSQIYVESVDLLNTYGNLKKGVGRSSVSNEQLNKHIPPAILLSNTHVPGLEVGIADLADAFFQEEYFNPEQNLPAVFPGHKQIQLAMDTIGVLEKRMGNEKGVRLHGFERVSFNEVVSLDNPEFLFIIPFIMEHTADHATYNVVIQNSDGVVVTELSDLRVDFLEEPYLKTLMEYLLLEGAIQTAHAVFMNQEGNKKIPVVSEIGKTEFYGLYLKADAGIEYIAKGYGSKRAIMGDVTLYSHGEKIAEVGSINAKAVDMDQMYEMIPQERNYFL